MLDLELSPTLLSCLLSLLLLLLLNCKYICKSISSLSSSSSQSSKLPKSYPIIGSFLAIYANRHRIVQWTADLFRSSSSDTFILRRPFGSRQVFTADPSVVQHILKTHFHVYPKGDIAHIALKDFLGDGIFNADAETWKFQRQVSSHEFNTRSLRNFVEHVVDSELFNRLIPILSSAAKNGTILDLQDILQRFAFDNICTIAFGYDPETLIPSLPDVKFAQAFEEAVRISSQRFGHIHPMIWKIKRAFDIGSEKQLRISVNEVREFAREILREKKNELKTKSSLDSFDLLSRFLSSGHSDEEFVMDIVISFILAGRDTTSAALIWFFWLVSRNEDVEREIVREIGEKSESSVYEEVKDMIYTHAALSESMRLYPPVPMDGKQAAADDVLPDGTFVKKGMRVTYHPYAMGRSEKLWGADWEEFRPLRWLKRNDAEAPEARKWNFVAKDAYTYPVFQAGPRVCLGKEMAFLQMKRVVAGVFRRFQVVPAFPDGEEPVYMAYLTTKMKGGFPVRIVERAGNF
ncbi:Cytochrome P450 94A2 like [Actinidia chinensis var. chinensis]|uniref:Cytochrome P450 94A2 like n=1 Tax=Actinidia chinensis var. chinensis TaxID=1590841 RepID=A0A2R6QTX4_ACTCC|nr:Cytochrome P450 94A2 like [Actinidia chinensis var. chinensis]